MSTVNDFFCGAGGMGLGFKQAGFQLAGAWDVDKWAVESYAQNVSPKVQQMDIKNLAAGNVPYADVWTFGFPCVDLSTIGKMQGMIKGQTRTGLFYEVMRLLDETPIEKRPKILLAENVKGLNKYFTELEQEYTKRGYRLYKTLYNSKYWGVGQSRERYFIVGVHFSMDKDFVFPSEKKEITQTLYDAIELDVYESYSQLSDYAIAKILHKLRDRKGFAYNYYNDRVYQREEPSPTITTQCSVWTRSSCIVLIEDRKKLRKLTCREIANLQGFPKEYQMIVSNEQLYKQFGNAVTVPVVKALAEAIKDFLKNE